MNTVLLAVLTVAVAVIAAFLVPLLIELKRTIAAVRKTIECNVDPALDELLPTLKNLHSVSDNVTAVTEDVKELSQAVGDVGRAIGAVNVLVEKAGVTAAVKATSIRVGVAAAIQYFIRNLFRKGEE